MGAPQPARGLVVGHAHALAALILASLCGRHVTLCFSLGAEERDLRLPGGKPVSSQNQPGTSRSGLMGCGSGGDAGSVVPERLAPVCHF